MNESLDKRVSRLRTNAKNLLITLVLIVCVVAFVALESYDKGWIFISPGYNSSTIQDCSWERKWGGLFADSCDIVRLDKNGDLVLAGYFTDIADLSPTAGIRLYNARRTGGKFVLNISPKARLRWIASLDKRTWGPDAMAINSRGEIILTGDGGNTWKLDSRGEHATIISDEIGGCAIAVDSGDNIILSRREGLVKLTPDGSIAWEIPQQVSGYALVLDSSDRIYAATEKLHIIGENGLEILSADLPGWATDMALDSNGDILVTGLAPWNDEVVEWPGYCRYADSFLCKIDRQGTVIWNREWKGQVRAIAVSAQNETYVTGRYGAPTDFDPAGSGTVQRAPGHASMAIFISKFDASGKFLGVKIGYEPWSSGNDIALDQEGNLYVTGHTRGDAFVARFDRGTF